MMFVNDLHLSFLFILISHLVIIESIETIQNDTIITSTSISNLTFDGNVTTKKTLFIQGQEIIHNSFNKIDRSTLMSGTIILASITCLILLSIGIKTFILRKKRLTRKYNLLSNATTMEEPIFNEHDNEEEDEREDDTLFVRK